jgi:phospholipid/cholesterol/gamma-HCH transport system ATP-binding protein
MNDEKQVMIRVENFTAAYDGTVVIDNVSFEVARGEVFVILGGSGCGKSTLLKHMIGLYQPASGRILIDGEDIASASGQERKRILRKFGVTYQSGALFGSMTLLENIRLPLEEFTRLPLEAMNLVARMKLHLVGLSGAEQQMPAQLSGGMQKRAAIARAMALDPEILFLDEPSAGLDPVTSAGLDDLILSLSRDLGMTFVVVTHELASIEKIAGHVIMLDKRTKGIIAEGTPEELKKNSPNDWVRDFFLRRAETTRPGEDKPQESSESISSRRGAGES